ncbi:MAG TPA: RraA family protein [Candidatus Limnocylindria bacterium]|jgi:regulator of RNase E activity RraA|nr:RraA family protein [Candidatus Limnocylindria bacterium]
MNTPMSPELLVSLRQYDSCTLANAVETFGVRLRNEGYCDARIRCLFPHLAPMIGHAVTVTIRCSGPSVEGGPTREHTDWWNHILSVPAPRVVVIQDLDVPAGGGAFLGEIHCAILRKLGSVGAVTNGSVRDLPAISAAGFPLFAAGTVVSHSYAHLVEVGAEVEVGGLKVRPGDWLHGDVHGVVRLPPEIGEQLPAAAERILEHERRILALCANDNVTLPQLRDAVTARASLTSRGT